MFWLFLLGYLWGTYVGLVIIGLAIVVWQAVRRD